MSYDPTIFVRGQRFRQTVIELLASQHIDYVRLPQAIDAGEIIRKSFYACDDAQFCASLIETAQRSHYTTARRSNFTRRAMRREDDMTELALAAIYAVLFPNALQGWEEWSRYAAAGEWQ